MPELQGDLATLGVHALDKLLSAGLLLVRVHGGRAVPAKALLRYGRALRDDQARARALLVVLNVAPSGTCETGSERARVGPYTMRFLSTRPSASCSGVKKL